MRSTPVARRFIVLSLFLLAVFPGSPGARAGDHASRVERVVLYPDMAQVTRAIEVAPPSDVVDLPGLPASLAPDSLSARVTKGEAEIVSVSVEDVFRPRPVSPRTRELEAKLEGLEDARRRADGTLADRRREKELLDRGVQAVFAPPDAAPGKERPARLLPAEIEASLALYRARARAIDNDVLALAREVRDLDREIQATRQELDKSRDPLGPGDLQEKKVRIRLARPASCRIALTYLTPAAGFAPRYNVRLRPSQKEISFELVGEAWQRTGEDWADVALTFSTSRPGRMAQLPPLPPWDIGFAPPPGAALDMAAPEAEAMGMMAARRHLAMEERAMAKAVAAPAPERKFASFEATPPGTHALPGSGERKSFQLSRPVLPVEVAWRAIPRVAEGAFVSAEGKNATGLPLLEAPVSLFLEDAFAGRGFVADLEGRAASIPEGAPFQVGFGKDDSVQVRRRELLRQEEKGGVFSKVRRVRFRYEIAVQNFRREAAPLTVLERIPVSRDKEIEVKDVEISGGGRAGESEPGEVRWDLSLAPGEKKSLGLSFVVEYPAGRQIEGL